MSRTPNIHAFEGPAGGWGSLRSIARRMAADGNPVSASLVLAYQNKPRGFACPSCAWAKPAKPHPFEFCENGAKATIWELTNARATPEFFARHAVTELESWSDHDLEAAGRLTHPLRYDPMTDRYLPVSWVAAFAEIGRELRAFDPHEVVLYASGRASLEASYLYQLFARMLGTNNLPDSSNMCHESTSVALPKSIGVPVGTVTLDDFQHTDAIFFFGQNPGSNSPRMLHDLQDARQRGVPIVTFNPLREPGLLSFTNPQRPIEMLGGIETRISTQYHQVKAGGDLAAIMGMCKALIARDDAAGNSGAPVLDREFIAEHTRGFDTFANDARGWSWEALERRSGLTRNAMEAAAAVYSEAKAAIGIYGMGLTQHREGVANVRMLVNLLLMRGNVGKRGAGVLPVRGHSNVQGQRTVGITEKPELVPLDRLARQFDFEPPRWEGLATVDACQAMINGKVRAFVGLGGNFLRAVPERAAMENAWRKLRLTVQVATKLNRSQVVRGEIAYILPCIGRTEIDRQASGVQTVSVEDSTACIHASRGMRSPPGPDVRSEVAIVAGLAKATLPPNPKADWDGWAADYRLIRGAIAETYPEFHDMEHRMREPGGFHRHLPARHREWHTATGKANFFTPESVEADPDMPAAGPDVLHLITLRSNNQFNTTVYGDRDRFRDVSGRMVVLMHRNDIDRLGLIENGTVTLSTVSDDGVRRELGGLTVLSYDIPEGCIGGYYPECNVLIPLWHHAKESKVPAAKSVPVRVLRGDGFGNGMSDQVSAAAAS
jgi:molybdopterin-dependent oxidoreductase alpha subunit